MTTNAKYTIASVCKLLSLSLALSLLASCAADHSQYRTNSPKLAPLEFFDGELCAWGTVHDFGGDVTRRFVATINATSSVDEDGLGQFELDEKFLFDDGERQTRLWQFTQVASDNNRWLGTAGDVDGQAEALIIGNMMSLKYSLIITQDGDQIRVNMDDGLHLINNNNMLGKTIMSKFGINLGEINIMLQKQTSGFAQCSLNAMDS